MKQQKYFLILLSIVLLFSLFGCKNVYDEKIGETINENFDTVEETTKINVLSIDTLPHSHVYHEISFVEPTCNTDGIKTLKCDCGEITEEIIPRIKHSFDYVKTISPTCVEEGQEIYQCKCGEQLITYSKKAEHIFIFSEKIIGSCLEKSKEIYKCFCGEIQEKLLDYEKHNYQIVAKIDPTCFSTGVEVYKCICGKEYTNNQPMIQHKFVLHSVTESTVDVQGMEIYKCEICELEEVQMLPLKLGAKDTDMCGESLLLCALPHAEYYDVVDAIFQRLQNKGTYNDNVEENVVFYPNQHCQETILEWYGDTYAYAFTLYSQANYIYENQQSGLYVWGDDEIYEKEKQIFDEVNRILSELNIDNNTTKKEAIVRINDYICETKYYEYDTSKLNASAFHSLFNPSSVCHNYSIAFQLLCLGAGIECHYYDNDDMRHAWNKVYFSDGSYYWVDVCWNDARTTLSDGTVIETSVSNGIKKERVEELRSRYLLITTEKLLEDHQV